MEYSVKNVTLSPPWLLDATNDGTFGSYPQRSRILSVQDAYVRVPLFYRGLRYRCNALLNLPRHIYKLNTQDPDKRDEVAWMFPVDLDWLLWRVQASILLAGGAPILKLRNETRRAANGAPQDLQWLNPFTVSVRWDPASKKRVYTQSGQTLVGGETRIWTDDDMIFVREYAPLDDVGYGVAAATTAFQSARVAFSIPQMAAQFFENGAMPVSILSVASPLDKDEQERLQGFFQRVMGGVRNAFRVLAISGDVKFTTTQNRMKDLAAAELKDDARKDIARALEIPVTLLDSDETMATAEIHMRSFYLDTVIPAAKMIASALNRDCLNAMGYTLEFAPQEMPIFQEDEQMRANAYKQYVDAGMDSFVAAAVLGIDIPQDMQELWRNSITFSRWGNVIEAARQNLVFRDEARRMMGLEPIDASPVFVGVNVRVNTNTPDNPVTGAQIGNESLVRAAEEVIARQPERPPEPPDSSDAAGGDADEQQLREAARQQKNIEYAQFRKWQKHRRKWEKRHGANGSAVEFDFKHLDEYEQRAAHYELGLAIKDVPDDKKRRDLALVLIALLRAYAVTRDTDALHAGIRNALYDAYAQTGATDAEISAMMDEQETYLNAFLLAVAAGELSARQIEQRAQMYAASVTALASRSAVNRAAETDDPALTWRMDPDAEHCTDCLALNGQTRKASEWKAANLYPGSLQTQCGQNCRCSLE